MEQGEGPRAGRWWMGLPWLLALAVGIYAFFGPSGYFDYRDLRQERQRLENRIAELESENRRLQRQIERLQEEPAFLERMARDRLGLVKPNERVVLVPRDDEP